MEARTAWPRANEAPVPPSDLLTRHRARVLDPLDDRDGAPTVYRADVLLAPARLLREHPGLEEINAILAEVGWHLAVDQQDGHGTVAVLRLGHVADLHPGTRPKRLLQQRLDAWEALRVLRLGSRGSDTAKVVAQLSLDHLLFATTSGPGGMPITEGHPGQPKTVLSDHVGRSPVAMLIPAPPRDAAVQSAGRRPVVAVLDTGCGVHTWFTASAGDPFVVDAGSRGWSTKVPKETTGVSDPLRGELDSHAGHGTFICGIVRQLAPDARVLSLRLMHSDGVVHESTLLQALDWIIGEVKSGDPSRFVDVVSMSFGYYEEGSADAVYTSQVLSRLDVLLAAGVQVVASAGNDATNRFTYPAALAKAAPIKDQVISVGALNPNRTRAIYSNQASWITHWEIGTRVVSTLPAFAGSHNPGMRSTMAGPDRESLDPDDFTGGFAQWSGTSFAAAAVAARLAQAMVSVSAANLASLRQTNPPAAKARATAARALLSK